MKIVIFINRVQPEQNLSSPTHSNLRQTVSQSSPDELIINKRFPPGATWTNRRYSTDSPVPTDSSDNSDDSNTLTISSDHSKHNPSSIALGLRRKKNRIKRHKRLQQASRRYRHVIAQSNRTKEQQTGCYSSGLSQHSDDKGCSNPVTTSGLSCRKSGDGVRNDNDDVMNTVVDDAHDQTTVLHYGGNKAKTNMDVGTNIVSKPLSIDNEKLEFLPAANAELDANAPPPNQSPFASKTSKKPQNKSSDYSLATVSPSKTEKSFEPVGPPNVTLPIPDSNTSYGPNLADLLQSKQSSDLSNRSKHNTNNNNGVQNNVSTPIANRQSDPYSKSTFPDQFDFIKEQASILAGRKSGDDPVFACHRPTQQPVFFPPSPLPSNASTPSSSLSGSPVSFYHNNNYRSHPEPIPGWMQHLPGHFSPNPLNPFIENQYSAQNRAFPLLEKHIAIPPTPPYVGGFYGRPSSNIFPHHPSMMIDSRFQSGHPSAMPGCYPYTLVGHNVDHGK